MTHKNKASERRLHHRFPVVEGIVEPITLNFDGEGAAGPKNQPALITDLSAGGLSLLLFLEPPHTKKLELILTLPGLSSLDIEGKVIRISQKGSTYNVGIAFTRISKKHQGQINDMAQDHLDCDTRISLKLPEVCVKTCRFHALCGKAQKAPHWPARHSTR